MELVLPMLFVNLSTLVSTVLVILATPEMVSLAKMSMSVLLPLVLTMPLVPTPPEATLALVCGDGP